MHDEVKHGLMDILMGFSIFHAVTPAQQSDLATGVRRATEASWGVVPDDMVLVAARQYIQRWKDLSNAFYEPEKGLGMPAELEPNVSGQPGHLLLYGSEPTLSYDWAS